MKQVLYDVTKGKIALVNIPVPAAKQGHLLIETRKSLLSSGTERMLLEFGKAGWITKIRQQPEKVRQVLDKMRTDGLFATLCAVHGKLEEPMQLGYSNVGVVREIGKGVLGFRVGDRVVSNGPHAEFVAVPAHLCAKIPDAVDDTNAVFTVTGAIGLQGIRLLKFFAGDAVAVIGLGLIGLQSCQILQALGARVIGFDLDFSRVALAKEFGTEAYLLEEGVDPVALAHSFSHGYGVHAVLITASTKSNEPIHHAAQMCRARGTIVLVGVVGLTLNRDDFYKKEISFQVSSSYGSDRYATSQRMNGVTGETDSTVQDNFRKVLQFMEEEKVRGTPLVNKRFPIEQATAAYETLLHDRNALGIVLEYPQNGDFSKAVVPLIPPVKVRGGGMPIVGCIGSGNFARRTLIPAFKKSGARLKTIVSSGGLSATAIGKKYGFEYAASDVKAVFQDQEINTVVISTPHSSHARFVCDALRAGKHVYVEKPLCTTKEELATVQEVYAQEAVSRSLLLMVGFNRRFAPLTMRLRQLLKQTVGPKSVVITVNTGAIPSDHWTQDPVVGGGRIIGEACHFLDLARFLVGAPIKQVEANIMQDPDCTKALPDTVTVTLRFQDGSVGTVHYFSNGSKRFFKERIEIFSSGRVFQMDNFRSLRVYGKWRTVVKRTWRQDKGHNACMAEFVRAVKEGGVSPIPFEEVVEVMEATFKVAGV